MLLSMLTGMSKLYHLPSRGKSPNIMVLSMEVFPMVKRASPTPNSWEACAKASSPFTEKWR